MKCLPKDSYKKVLNNRDSCWIDKNTSTWHSFNDQPYRRSKSGNDLYWRKRGEIHRDYNKPALIRRDGGKEWWINGSYVRDEKE